MTGDGVALAVTADRPWDGTLVFDRARHAEYLHLPIDWPRINQFPEWFTVAAGAKYHVQPAADGTAGVAARDVSGEELRQGLKVRLVAGQPLRLTVRPLR